MAVAVLEEVRGVIRTLQLFKPGSLEADLERFVPSRPIGLVLAALYSEVEESAIQ